MSSNRMRQMRITAGVGGSIGATIGGVLGAAGGGVMTLGYYIFTSPNYTAYNQIVNGICDQYWSTPQGGCTGSQTTSGKALCNSCTYPNGYDENTELEGEVRRAIDNSDAPNQLNQAETTYNDRVKLFTAYAMGIGFTVGVFIGGAIGHCLAIEEPQQSELKESPQDSKKDAIVIHVEPKTQPSPRAANSFYKTSQTAASLDASEQSKLAIRP